MRLSVVVVALGTFPKVSGMVGFTPRASVLLSVTSLAGHGEICTAHG